MNFRKRCGACRSGKDFDSHGFGECSIKKMRIHKNTLPCDEYDALPSALPYNPHKKKKV